MHLHKNFSLKNLNTFGIDVQTRYYAELNSTSDLKELFSSDIMENEKRIVLGGGSNILFTKDFEGVVIKNNLKGITLVSEDDQYYYVNVGGGEDWHELVLYSLDQNWYGLENLSLIPGCVGAAPIQNIGAYGVELKEVFHSLNFYHFSGHLENFTHEACQFGYRNSIFKGALKGKGVITDVTLRLTKKPAINISYGVLSNYFNGTTTDQVSPKMVSHAVIDIRRSKLPDPAELGNAGSFFKNPVIDHQQLHELQSDYPDIPHFDLDGVQYKIPAAWLIDQCKWKGKRYKHVGVHDKQALVIVNHGNASGEEVINLANEIRHTVQEKFNISLEPEVNVV